MSRGCGARHALVTNAFECELLSLRQQLNELRVVFCLVQCAAFIASHHRLA